MMWSRTLSDSVTGVWQKASGLSLLLLFCFLMACSGEDSPSVGGETRVPDACSLLADADVEGVFNSAVTSVGEVTEDGLFTLCTWTSITSGERMTLSIWTSGQAGDGWATEFLAAQSGSGQRPAVDNLGAEAYSFFEDDVGNYYWRVDDAYVVFFASVVDNGVPEDTLFGLAQKIDSGL